MSTQNAKNNLSNAIFNSQRFSELAEKYSSLNSGAASLIKTIEENHAKVMSAFADWIDLAIQMDPDQDGKTQVERRLQYPTKNQANQAHIALYGNRTLTEASEGVKNGSSTVNYSASENLNYWEEKWDTIKDEEDGMNGPSFAKCMTFVRLEEARNNWAFIKAQYEAAVSLYETLMSIPFVYEPYEEKKVIQTTSAPNNIALFQKLIKGSPSTYSDVPVLDHKHRYLTPPQKTA
jgi:hypothetical protein